MTKRRFLHSNNPGFPCHESVILLPFGRRSYLEAVVALQNGVEIPMDETTDRLVFDLETAPVPVILVYSGMGSPAAANALEMVAANGARQVLLFGACGGVDREVEVGDLLIPSGAIRGECAAAAIVGRHLDLRVAALLFCTDNVSLPDEADRSYRGLQDERVRRGFEAGLQAVIAALTRAASE